MAGQWVLKHKVEVEQFSASFPEHSEETLPKFIAISHGGDKRFMKSTKRPYASGQEVWVSDSELKEIQDGTQVTVTSASSKRYRIHRVRRDAKLRLALLGLVLSIVAIAIAGGVAIGKERPVFIVSRSVFAVWLWVGLFCQIVGALLLFWKGVLEAD